MEAKTGILKNFATLILAAGFSGRMGIPKLSLRFDEDRSFAEKIIQTYQSAGCRNIVMIVNEQGENYLRRQKVSFTENDVTVILNMHPERERFYSLQTGLRSVQNGLPVFVQNIDNPFVETELLQQLANIYTPEGYVVPRYNGRGGHPVLLSERIVNDITTSLDWGQNLRNFLQAYPQISCPVDDEKILININSPKEYRKYFSKSGKT